MHLARGGREEKKKKKKHPKTHNNKISHICGLSVNWGISQRWGKSPIPGVILPSAPCGIPSPLTRDQPIGGEMLKGMSRSPVIPWASKRILYNNYLLPLFQHLNQHLSIKEKNSSLQKYAYICRSF